MTKLVMQSPVRKLTLAEFAQRYEQATTELRELQENWIVCDHYAMPVGVIQDRYTPDYWTRMREMILQYWRIGRGRNDDRPK